MARMAPDDPRDDSELPAGDFSTWLAEIQGALRGERGADVPCGTCTACCTSSQFVHIGPDETDTLEHIPAELLFPAPRLPRGHMLLGYDERGHCPMLIDGKCSIYEHRPRTCRTYDCRVFAATGVTLDDEADKSLIARQVKRWRFGLPRPADREARAAVQAAAAFLREPPAPGADGPAPANATQRAVRAIEIHARFLPPEPDP
jgi:Fe-S-cluster containining protein